MMSLLEGGALQASAVASAEQHAGPRLARRSNANNRPGHTRDSGSPITLGPSACWSTEGVGPFGFPTHFFVAHNGPLFARSEVPAWNLSCATCVCCAP